MMFLEKIDDYQAVIKEAEQIYDEFDDGMIRNMVLVILRHLMVYSDKILDKERRRVINKYFSTKDQTRILLDRQKALQSQNIWAVNCIGTMPVLPRLVVLRLQDYDLTWTCI